MSDKLTVYPLSGISGSCNACNSEKRIVEVRAASMTIRFCEKCALKLMGAFASLYGVEPVHSISDNPELIEEFEALRHQLSGAQAIMRRMQAHVTQGN